MDDYDLQKSVRPFVLFVEDLTNWYIRRSRRRFWKSQNDADKLHAYRTLRYVLVQLCKVAAPFTPFISDAIYRNLRGKNMPESVHLCEFPSANEGARNEKLERYMAIIQRVVSLGRQLRTDNDLKVRQPLAMLHIVSSDLEIRKQFEMYDKVLQTDLGVSGAQLSSLGVDKIAHTMIEDELNVKAMRFDRDETAFVHLDVKADFRKLGPRFGAKMKLAAAAIAALPSGQAAQLAAGKSIQTIIDNNHETIEPTDVVVQRTPRDGLVVAAEGNVIVAIEIKLTPELVREGLAREFVSKVQNLRKEADFEVSQRIVIEFAAGDEVAAAIQAHRPYIESETLAISCVRQAKLPDATELDLNGRACRVRVARA